MNYENLYNQAINGNADALKELKVEAGSGNAHAQFILSCVYDNIDSPFPDESLSIYWLKKSAGYEFEPAIRKLKELSPEIKKQYEIEESKENDDTATIKPGGIWSFRGRIDRATYFVYFVVYVLLLGLLLYLINLIPMESTSVNSGYYSYDMMRPTGFAIWTELIVRLVMAYLSLALCVKRMHDCGHSGWWVLIPFCPLALFFMKGEDKTNEYGPKID